ncbi:hypothetical protein [Haladaptatus sp. DYF46]|uniref:hypothetical protein n=1 Tax=Haladaptatus sp. DYF46 TaxID=2886041 RepID=UPI001E2895A2|nr:hypothetical protein [Haladaptatus sp. DYF46]
MTGRIQAIEMTANHTKITITVREDTHDSQHAMLATDAIVDAEEWKTVIATGDEVTTAQNVLMKDCSGYFHTCDTPEEEL